MTNCCPEEAIGASPLDLTWRVVRGDSSSLMVLFVESDEETPIETSGWSYQATAFDPVTEQYYELGVDSEDEGVVIIYVDPEVTATWGRGTARRASNLVFDLKVTREDGAIWTPVVGEIQLVIDVTSEGAQP